MPIDIEKLNAYKALQEDVARLQDAYYTYKERCELNPENTNFADAFSQKKIELAQASVRLKNFEKKYAKLLKNE
jgi:hypothetical protein